MFYCENNNDTGSRTATSATSFAHPGSAATAATAWNPVCTSPTVASIADLVPFVRIPTVALATVVTVTLVSVVTSLPVLLLPVGLVITIPGVGFFSARKLDFFVTTTFWAGHFTESAGTQANPCRRAWHLNWPMLSVAGTQASPHALSRHGQTIFTQLTKLPRPEIILHPGGKNLPRRARAVDLSRFKYPGPALEQSTFDGVRSFSGVVFVNTKGVRVVSA